MGSCPLSADANSFKEAAATLNQRWASEARKVLLATAEIEELAQKAYGLDEETTKYVESAAGRHPLRIATKDYSLARVKELWSLSEEQLVDRCRELSGASRAVTKNSWWADRRVELIAAALAINADDILRAVEVGELAAVDVSYEATVALEYLFGTAIGDRSEALRLEPHGVFDHEWARAGRIRIDGPGILVDDDGHPDDIVKAVENALIAEGAHHQTGGTLEELVVLASGSKAALRTWLRASLFELHISHYSRSRRKAPIYWQLATSSASYSVWTCIHGFSKDTLFRIQNDYVAPKLAHEERRLESFMRELGDGATGAQRKHLAAQEGLVDELRAFLDEVKRVAPLWMPNLDDGVIINFAPLWRLVPHNKAWQKELKATWDAMSEGEYDWAHLAMHLWPERVVPKCAKDRSFAIAHGLEDVFWVEGADGRWAARTTPTKTIDELVKARTSPAVKSALKSLLEAPVASAKRSGRKASGRRKAAAHEGDA